MIKKLALAAKAFWVLAAFLLLTALYCNREIARFSSLGVSDLKLWLIMRRICAAAPCL